MQSLGKGETRRSNRRWSTNLPGTHCWRCCRFVHGGYGVRFADRAPIAAQAYVAMHAVRTGEKWVRFLRVAPIRVLSSMAAASGF
jgi:hypothetical protein